MAVENSLVEKKESNEVKYLANGEEVKLTPGMVKKYLVSGNPNAVTNEELVMFMSLCKYQHLNPFLREAYLVKYGEKNPATIVTGKDTFLKRAERNPKYKGKASGIVVQNAKGGAIEYRDGTLHLDGEKIVGGWAKVFIEGREPEMTTVSFEEYAAKKSDGSLNQQWATKPATMIRKVAVVQALREAFPEDFGALYSPEEMGNVAEAIPEQEAPVEIESVVKPVESPVVGVVSVAGAEQISLDDVPKMDIPKKEKEKNLKVADALFK